MIKIQCLKVYELVLCSENNENRHRTDQVGRTIEANIHAGEARGREKERSLGAQEEKETQTWNHASKVHSIMVVDKDGIACSEFLNYHRTLEAAHDSSSGHQLDGIHQYSLSLMHHLHFAFCNVPERQEHPYQW
jgi:hypothetical protein